VSGRLAIIIGGLGVAVLSFLFSSSWDVRAVACSLGLFSTACGLGPPEARAFLRREWPAIARLLASIILTGVAIVLAKRAKTQWITIGVTIGAAVGEIAFVLIDRKLRSWLKWLTVDQWRAIDDETDRTAAETGRTSWTVLVVLVVCAVSLTLQEYIGDRGQFERWFLGGRDKYHELKGFAWWSGWRVLGYVVMPMLAIGIMAAVRQRDYRFSPRVIFTFIWRWWGEILPYHVSLRGFFSHFWIYLLMFSLIFPAVIEASTTESFRHTYPFYRLANRSQFDLWTWEAFYAAQFVSLEFFFRGFLLHALRKVMGANAIFVMIVPYCMIHYGKPMPETLGAIGAGVILGTLAMRTRSIWGGVMIHIGVAITMDVLALRGCPPIGSGRSCGH
jgi:membrane protease YdiL (CAAX protease family)